MYRSMMNRIAILTSAVAIAGILSIGGVGVEMLTVEPASNGKDNGRLVAKASKCGLKLKSIKKRPIAPKKKWIKGIHPKDQPCISDRHG